MLTQTRRLIELLTDGDTETLIEQLMGAPATVRELEESTGLSESTVGRRLRDLEGWGIVEPERRRSAGSQGGRRATEWHTIGDAYARFSNLADSFASALLDERAERMRNAIGKRRQATIRPVDEKPA